MEIILIRTKKEMLSDSSRNYIRNKVRKFKNPFCKVEFNQPFCWLYSVPNLLVIQHLETLYLGGNHVRVVCESVKKSSKVCILQGLATGSREWLTASKSLKEAHV